MVLLFSLTLDLSVYSKHIFILQHLKKRTSVSSSRLHKQRNQNPLKYAQRSFLKDRNAQHRQAVLIFSRKVGQHSQLLPSSNDNTEPRLMTNMALRDMSSFNGGNNDNFSASCFFQTRKEKEQARLLAIRKKAICRIQAAVRGALTRKAILFLKYTRSSAVGFPILTLLCMHNKYTIAVILCAHMLKRACSCLNFAC